MAKFNVLENKMLIVNGSLVNVAKGEFETEDKALIAALSKAVNVEELDATPKAPSKSQVTKKLKALGIEFDGSKPVEELILLLPAE